MTRETIPDAERVLGREHSLTLRTRLILALSLYKEARHSEALTIFEEVTPVAKRVYGPSHPLTEVFQQRLVAARLLARLAPAKAE